MKKLPSLEWDSDQVSTARGLLNDLRFQRRGIRMVFRRSCSEITVQSTGPFRRLEKPGMVHLESSSDEDYLMSLFYNNNPV